LAQQGTVHDMILGCRPIYRFAGANSIRIIGIRYGIVAVGDRGQPPAVLPGKLVTVTVGEGVADLIIGDGYFKRFLRIKNNTLKFSFNKNYLRPFFLN